MKTARKTKQAPLKRPYPPKVRKGCPACPLASPPPSPGFLRQLCGLIVAALCDFLHWPRGGKLLPQTTPLHEATRQGNIVELRRLLKEGANPNVLDAELNTPLHCAWSHKATALLLEFGASPNVTNIHNRTPLDLARGKQAQILYSVGAYRGTCLGMPGYVEPRPLHDD